MSPSKSTQKLTPEKVAGLIFSRDVTKIQALIKKGDFNVNSIATLDRSALALCASGGYTDIMECLIKNGADINMNNPGDLGYTPIQSAARDGQLEAVALLIRHHADIDKGDTIGSNALIGACISAEKNILKLLLKNGADVNHCDNQGQTALHYLCKYAKQWGGATITETIHGKTKKLRNTRFKQHTDIFKILLTHKANVNAVTNYGYSSLQLCAESNTPDFVPLLVQHGAAVNWQNTKGSSAIQVAADENSTEAAQELVKQGARVDIVDNDGFTPLLAAVAKENVVLVKLFLAHGAKKNVKAAIDYGVVQKGDDAVHLAKRLGNKQLIGLINT